MNVKHLLATFALGVLFPGLAAAASELELRAEIHDRLGRVVAKPVLRLRPGEPASVTVSRAGADYHLEALVEPGGRAGCHSVRVSLREPGDETGRDSVSALCGERPVSLVRSGGATLGLQLVTVR